LANITRMSSRLLRMVRDAQEHPLGLLKLIITDDEGAPPTIKDFHKQWMFDLVTARDVLHEASRGLTKTVSHLVALTWYLGKRSELRTKILSDNDNNAKKKLRYIRELIQKSDLLPLVFPKLKLDKDAPNNDHILSLERERFAADPSIESYGVMSSGIGSRTDILLLDDIVSYSNALAKPQMQQTVKEKVLVEWLPTCAKNACIWSCFTPWTVDDVNATFKKDRIRWRYTLTRHGNKDNPCFSIFPELWSEERLRKELRTLGQLNYARAYRCEALSSDTRLILPEHLVSYSQITLTPSMLARATVVVVVDPAKGTAKSKDPDYTGVVVMLIVELQPTVKGDDGFRVFVPEAFGFRASTGVQADVVSALCHHWGASYLLVEDQGLSSLHEWIYQPRPGSPPAPQATLIPYSTKAGKELMVKAITPLLDRAVMGLPACVAFHPGVIQDGQLPTLVLQDELRYLYERCPALAAAPVIEMHRNLRDEAVNFSVAAHDDIIDPLSRGLQWANIHLRSGRIDDSPGLDVISINF